MFRTLKFYLQTSLLPGTLESYILISLLWCLLSILNINQPKQNFIFLLHKSAVFLVFLVSQRGRKKRKGSFKIHGDLSWGNFSNDDDHLVLNMQAQVSEGHGAWRGNQQSLQAEKSTSSWEHPWVHTTLAPLAVLSFLIRLRLLIMS